MLFITEQYGVLTMWKRPWVLRLAFDIYFRSGRRISPKDAYKMALGF